MPRAHKKDSQDIWIDGLQYPRAERQYFVAARAAGLDLIHITVVYWQNCAETISLLADWFSFIARNDDLLYPALSRDGLEQVNDQKRIGLIFGLQNCSPIENNLFNLEILRRLNVGIMQLSYNNQSPLCCGCYEHYDSGLTRFGRQAISRMNKLGMIVDMSHSSERSTLEAIEQSERPITISHAQSSYFHPATRNKSETVIKELIASGGMLGLSLYPLHIKGGGDCQLTDLTDEIRRLADNYGIERLGFGTDLCQGQPASQLVYMRNGRWIQGETDGDQADTAIDWPRAPKWFARVDDWRQLHQGLLAAGFSDAETQRLLGLNWLGFLSSGLSPKP